MRSRVWLLLLWAAGSLAAQNLVIRHVTVIDATGAPPQPDRTVWIERGVITRIGPGSAPAGGGTVIDGKGQYLIPGLWDMHTHLWFEQSLFPVYLRFGVTGVRDMGSDLERTRKWSRQVAAGTLVGPRVITCGPAMDGRLPRDGGPLPVRAVGTPMAARAVVDDLDKQDVPFLKILSGVPRNSFFVISELARTYRVPLAGHLPDEVSLQEACDARMHSIEHLLGMAMACTKDEYDLKRRRERAIEKKDSSEYLKVLNAAIDGYDDQKAKLLFSSCSRLSTWFTPTLGLQQRMDLQDLDRLVNDPAVELMPQSIRKTWEDPRDALKSVKPERLELYNRDFKYSLFLVGVMKRSGARLLAGSDSGDPYVVPGAALHDELALLVQAGLTPMEALQSATKNAAEFLHQERLGTVERGKTADLVLLEANPLEDIRNTRKIRSVIVRGKVYSAKQLEGMARAQ